MFTRTASVTSTKPPQSHTVVNSSAQSGRRPTRHGQQGTAASRTGATSLPADQASRTTPRTASLSESRSSARPSRWRNTLVTAAAGDCCSGVVTLRIVGHGRPRRYTGVPGGSPFGNTLTGGPVLSEESSGRLPAGRLRSLRRTGGRRRTRRVTSSGTAAAAIAASPAST
jgi:hypothetical protein